MSAWMEVVMPVRDPGDKLHESIASLAAQTGREFAVLFSDNFSTKGQEHLALAQRTLAEAGIESRVVRPPFALGRVEHWNWAHSQARAPWLKPLFVGDLLAPGYATALHARVIARPDARVARCEFDLRTPEKTQPMMRAPTAQEALTPAEFLGTFPRLGNWLGGPVNFAYHRLAWQAAGGYAPHLPACADLALYVTMIAHHGLELLHEPLATFQLHTQRFSHGITRRKVNGAFEMWLILRELRNYCLSVGLPWPEHGVRDGVMKQLRVNYLEPQKARVKQWLGRTR